ncbi:MAG: type I-C CRISPR-associated protein Cas8c/Csd1 [Planctomycetes bacterium]|nr:type I-C CRISPR-associated protein Cas8c/Csd1 [Planctomycetota bacterium]
MILQALYKLAEDEHLIDDLDYQLTPVAWLVRVADGGVLLPPIQSNHIEAKGTGAKGVPKLEGMRRRVPTRAPSRSGTKPPAEFLVDNPLYVFGTSVDEKYGKDVASQRASDFREKVRRCWQQTGDQGVKAVLDFLDAVAADPQAVDLPLTPKVRSNDLFAFVYAPDRDMLVSDRPLVEQYWREVRRSSLPSGAGTFRCLVTGAPCIPVEKHPKLKHVPQKGGAGDLALVPLGSPSDSFESYGWIKNDNAPVSPCASEACARALNRLLDPAPRDPANPQLVLPRRNLRLSADTVVCYWAADKRSDDFLSCFGALLDANPDEVKALYQSVWRGIPPTLEDPSAFYALTLSGAQGRATVRDWFESTVQTVAGNLAQHFADLSIVRNTPKPKGRDHPPHFRLRDLLESLAPPAEHRSEGVPAPLAAELVRAALHKTPYPFSLLQRAVLRFRAEIAKQTDEKEWWSVLDRNDARVALIKAVINRSKRVLARLPNSYEEVKQDMDPTNANPGYLLGRLMAVVERMQQLTLPDVGSTVVDRFFSGASASPAAAFPRLLKNMRHHASKAKDDDKKRGTARWLDGQADDILTKLPSFPPYLSLEQQGFFVLGYHQQRHWLWMSKEDRTQLEARSQA